MNHAISNFIIHVSDTLSDQDMARLAGSVSEDACVTSAHVAEGNPHLIMVDYDSDCESARDIVRKLIGQGIHAQAVGM